VLITRPSLSVDLLFSFLIFLELRGSLVHRGLWPCLLLSVLSPLVACLPASFPVMPYGWEGIAPQVEVQALSPRNLPHNQAARFVLVSFCPSQVGELGFGDLHPLFHSGRPVLSCLSSLQVCFFPLDRFSCLVFGPYFSLCPLLCLPFFDLLKSFVNPFGHGQTGLFPWFFPQAVFFQSFGVLYSFPYPR